jgi:hypothetical protein
MTTVAELRIQSPVAPWQRLGLHVVDDATRVGGITLRFEPGDGGVVGWGLTDAQSATADIDGLVTTHVPASAGHVPQHRLHIVGWDHLVVMTSSLERTCGAIESATGQPLRRIREAGPVRQGFHRLGDLIVEVVETAQVTAPTASFWGFVWNVADLHETCEVLGPDVIGLPKAAVQPGRFIATIRSGVGLGLPLALMTAP